MELYSIIGWLGAVLFVFAYLLLVLNKISANGRLYHILNFLGALCLIFNGYVLSDFPNVVVNLIWAVIALFAVVKILFFAKL